MMTLAQWDVPLCGLNHTCVDRAPQQIMHALIADFAIREVLGVVWLAFQKASDLSLRLKATNGIPLKRFLDDRGKGFIRDQELAVLSCADVLQTNRRDEHPITFLKARFHLLDGLSSVLFTLQLPLSCEDGFGEAAFGRIFKLEIQAFNTGTACGQLIAQHDVELRITGKAFEIIKDDGVALRRLRIEKREERHHAGALHEVPAT